MVSYYHGQQSTKIIYTIMLILGNILLGILCLAAVFFMAMPYENDSTPTSVIFFTVLFLLLFVAGTAMVNSSSYDQGYMSGVMDHAEHLVVVDTLSDGTIHITKLPQ